MFSRRFILLFAVTSVLIIATGYFTSRFMANDLQTHLQTETNRLAYARVLLATRSLGDAVETNNYAEIRQVLYNLSEDSEIECVQYRDDRSLISSRDNNQPCAQRGDDGLFSITLGDEHSHDGEHAGRPPEKKILEVAVKGESTRRLGGQVKYPFLVLGVEFIIALFLVGLYFTLSSRALSNFLIGSLKKISKGETADLPKSILLDSQPVKNSLSEIEKNLEEYKKLVSERVESEVMIKVASQVSHDVRAPLGALELVIGNLKSISSEDREILRSSMTRIRDISDSLLSNQKQITKFVSADSSHFQASSEELVEFDLDAAVNEIVREKRLSLPEKVRIDYMPGSLIVVKAQPIEFKRLLSNLLNNAIEACTPQGGVVRLLDTVNGNTYVLTIQDTGKGISPEDLAKLGNYGVTLGKEEGKGIGLHHAIQTLRYWGGDLRIESTLGEGTTVHITMKTAIAEEALWKNRRVIALGLKGGELTELKNQSQFIYVFYAFAEFRKYYSTNFAELDDVMFVVRDSTKMGEWTSVLLASGIPPEQIVQFSNSSRYT